MTHICRACFQETSVPNFFEITNDEKSSQIKIEMLLCIPEIDLNLLGNPILCTPCLASLNTSYRFKKQCLYTEERIRSYLRTSNNYGKVSILDVYRSCSLLGLVLNSRDVGVAPAPKRSYIDDLNDLLDDALHGKDVGRTDKNIHLVPVKVEDVPKIEQPVLDKDFVCEKTECSPAQGKKTSATVNSKNTESVANTNKYLQCKFCPYKTMQHKLFITHRAKHVNKPKVYHCTICSFKTLYGGNLNKHVKNHKIKPLITCPKCDFTTLYANDLKKHQIVAHSTKNTSRIPKNKSPKLKNKAQTLVCKKCQYNGVNINDLKQHLQDVHNQSVHMCLICNKITNSKFNLKQHMRKHPTKSTTNAEVPTAHSSTAYKCKMCSYTSNNSHAFSSHMRIHKERLQCVQCSYSSTILQKLNMHYLNVHGTTDAIVEGTSSCHICDFKSTSKQNVTNHVRRMHKDATKPNKSVGISTSGKIN